MVVKKRFEDVILLEIPVLYRVAKRLTLSASDAEDMVGQALLSAAKAWDAFDGRHPRSWLIRILRNEHLTDLRRKGSRPVTAPVDADFETACDPWPAVHAKLTAEAIVHAMDTLPEEYRLTIALCDVEEMSYEEVAEALSIPLGTVRSRLFRGRKLLRQRFALHHGTTPHPSLLEV